MCYKILSIGYYNRGNLGDELFKICLLKLFKNSVITFINGHDYITIEDNYDIIFLGPGNVMNNYFIDRLKKLIKTNVWMLLKPLIGFGVGFESEYILEDFKYFDFIITRTRNNKTLLNLI